MKDPRKLGFPVQSIPNTRNDWSFHKNAEAVPCMTASVEEFYDHLINVLIVSHDYHIKFLSDKRKSFVGNLPKELMKRSQVTKAHSTIYHPQTYGLFENQN